MNKPSDRKPPASPGGGTRISESRVFVSTSGTASSSSGQLSIIREVLTPAGPTKTLNRDVFNRALAAANPKNAPKK